MNVLVLGGTRFMGIHLLDELLSNGHDVTIATRGKTPDKFGDRIIRKIIERQDPDALISAFSDEFYDVVIDNLAYCSNDVRSLLDAVHTSKYILTSTASVYSDFHMDIKETEVDTKTTVLKWCGYDDYTYDEVKRQAESAVFQAYSNLPSVAVRFPWIFGTDDYTKRLFFYVEHIFNEKAMNVDNCDARLAFINSREAGRFLAYCVDKPIFGSVNACSSGTISLAEIINYTEKRTGKKALLQECGESAPLNTVPSFSLDTAIARNAGYVFQDVNEWVYPTIDFWIDDLRTTSGAF